MASVPADYLSSFLIGHCCYSLCAWQYQCSTCQRGKVCAFEKEEMCSTCSVEKPNHLRSRAVSMACHMCKARLRDAPTLPST